jgi:haloalkane dehalogenase
VVFFHGEPTWSYLWRKVIAPVRDAGYRCIAPDYAAFGRSDKPTDTNWYSYDRHTDLAAGLLADLDLRDATAVVHDWGGPIGLRVAVEHPDRISRLAILDTGLSTGKQPMSYAWRRFRDFVERTEDLPVSMLVRSACARGMSDDVAAAGRPTLEALREDLWADSDFILPFAVGERFAAAVSAPPPPPIERASHFLQEDAGEEIGALIADWLG